MSEQFLPHVDSEGNQNENRVEVSAELNDRQEEKEIKVVEEIIKSARDKKPSSIRMLLGAVLALAPLTSLACASSSGSHLERTPHGDVSLREDEAVKPMLEQSHAEPSS